MYTFFGIYLHYSHTDKSIQIMRITVSLEKIETCYAEELKNNDRDPGMCEAAEGAERRKRSGGS